jgi:hypothetical protein
MSCNRFTTISNECLINFGGIKELWIAYLNDIASVQFTDPYSHLCKIGMETGILFTEWQFQKGNCSYTVDGSTDSFGVTEYTHSISLKLNRRDYIKNSHLWDVFDGVRDVVCIVKDANDQNWLLGWDEGLTPSVSGGSGSVISDGSGYNITFTGIQRKQELSFDNKNFDEITIAV